MQESHKSTRIPNSLRPPKHRLRIALAVVLIHQAILSHTVALVRGANGEHEQKSQRGARDKGKQVRVGEGVDIVHPEGRRHAEFVDERRHELGVRLEGDKSRASVRGVGICCRRHGGRFVYPYVKL